MWRNWKLSLIPLAVLAVVCTVRSVRLGAQSSQALPNRIGTSEFLVTLPGNRHPLANLANDRGRAAPDVPMQRMLLVLKRDPALEADLQQLIADQQDKSSPRYHAWLTPQEVGDRFGASPSERQVVASWLQSQGFAVNRLSWSGMVIEFSGTSGQVETAFHTQIHSYFAGGQLHFANASDPQIPAALAPVVAGVSTLHNFEKQPPLVPLGTASRIGNTSTWQPNFTFNSISGALHFLAPGDLAKIYNLTPLFQAGIDGTGQSMAIVARSNVNLSDIQVFRLAFGLPLTTPQVILNGPDPGSLFNPDESEADLDVEWSGAMAPKATIKLVVSGSTNATDGVDLSAEYIVENNLAPVMSTSFGACEASIGAAEWTFYTNLWQQAAAQGITAIVASGDSGAAGCDNPFFGPATRGPAVSGLASTPYNIAVGGSQFNENGVDSKYWSPTNSADQSSALGYIPENVWNESCSNLSQCFFVTLFASGGGPSAFYMKPTWQAGLGVPNDGKRDIPDVSLAAAAGHDGYLLCQDGICITNSSGQLIEAFVVGGTSASAPSFAGIMALVNQKTGSRQGQANFVLYPLAAAQNAANCDASAGPQASCIFNDITQGNNSVPGQAGASATPGYDLATGLGSLNAANLVSNWANVTFRGSSANLQLSPTSITHGQPVNVSVSVSAASGTGTPSGDVALLAGSQPINIGNLTAGTISAAVTTLPGGSYSATAAYGGDGTFGSSVSNAVPVSVTAEPSTTTLVTQVLSTNGSLGPGTTTTYSAPLFFQGSVVGASKQGNASGTLTISDTFSGNTTTVVTSALDSRGEAFITNTSPLGIGTHSLSASYSGDSSFQPSASAPVTLTVTKGATQTSLFVPAGALPNTAVTLEADVFPTLGQALPTGTVQFFDGGVALGSPAQVQSFVALLTTSQLQNGSNSITATYSGDSNFTGSTSTASIIMVGNPDFQMGVNPGVLTVATGSPGKGTLLLSPGSGLGFAGNVTVSCSGLPTGATCSFQPQPVVLDGFDTTSVALMISESSSQASIRLASDARRVPGFPSGPLAAIAAASLLLLTLRPGRERCLQQACACVVLLCALCIAHGCGSSSFPSTPTPVSPAAPTPPDPTIVTITAAGGSGSTAVSHSVQIAVTFK
jgi:large repetitive protein